MKKQELIEKIALMKAIDESEIALLSKEELKMMYQVLMYSTRRHDGQQFSDLQGAKLVLANIPDIAKKEISSFFANLQNSLGQGWWKSAQREVNDMQPNQFVSQELINEVKDYIDAYVEESY